eukprot:TRINITY_DN4435_c0_g1_i1.p1 TRINITY_DN4435_c0_g1~~TRINITY_DN4435_c0_g1_i1.p1  ORF type:complete len:490 (+),score=142.00 TRINITY_DN4435_c0_g1_i1:79-1470(+)
MAAPAAMAGGGGDGGGGGGGGRANRNAPPEAPRTPKSATATASAAARSDTEAAPECEHLRELQRLRKLRNAAYAAEDFERCGELRDEERKLAAAAKAVLRALMQEIHEGDGDYSECTVLKRRIQAIDEQLQLRVAPPAVAPAAEASTPGLSPSSTVPGRKHDAVSDTVSCRSGQKHRPSKRPKLLSKGPATKQEINSILALSWDQVLHFFPAYKAHLAVMDWAAVEKQKREALSTRVRAEWDGGAQAVRDHITTCIDIFREEQRKEEPAFIKPVASEPPAHTDKMVTLHCPEYGWVQVARADIQLATTGQTLPAAGSRVCLTWCPDEWHRRRCFYMRKDCAAGCKPGQKVAEYVGQHDCRNYHVKRGLVQYYIDRRTRGSSPAVAQGRSTSKGSAGGGPDIEGTVAGRLVAAWTLRDQGTIDDNAFEMAKHDIIYGGVSSERAKLGSLLADGAITQDEYRQLL